MQNLSDLTGENDYKKAPKYPLNEVTFNGKDGHFIYRNVIKGPDQNGEYEKVNLGASINVVFLQHRRVLSQYRTTEPSLMTNEHRHYQDFVMLFGANEKGQADELRKKYPGLRTVQIIYCYLIDKKEIVRLKVKGASLRSENKPKEIKGYYDYIASFVEGDSSSAYITKLEAATESGKLGSYKVISFVCGDKLDDEKLQKIIPMIKEVSEKNQKIDVYYAKKNAQEIVSEVKEELPVVEYPVEEGANPDEIPF